MGWFDTSGILAQQGDLLRNRNQELAQETINRQRANQQLSKGVNGLAGAAQDYLQHQSLKRVLNGKADENDYALNPQAYFSQLDFKAKQQAKQDRALGQKLAIQGEKLPDNVSPDTVDGFTSTSQYRFDNLGASGLVKSNKITGETELLYGGDREGGRGGGRGSGASDKNIYPYPHSFDPNYDNSVLGDMLRDPDLKGEIAVGKDNKTLMLSPKAQEEYKKRNKQKDRDYTKQKMIPDSLPDIKKYVGNNKVNNFSGLGILNSKGK